MSVLHRSLSALTLFAASFAASAQTLPIEAPQVRAPLDRSALDYWAPEDGGNGHYYVYFDAAVDWHEALRLAGLESFEGMTGYLVTLTSEAENAFVSTTVAGGLLAWAGASDDIEEGLWTWRSGPEAGMALSYTNWAPGEPNDCCSGEDYLHINWGPGSWNDHGGPGNPGQLNGYVVEFSAVVPEPGAALLWAGGLAVLLGSRRRA